MELLKNYLWKKLSKMKSDLQIYLDNTRLPWGVLFYRMVLEQLDFAKGLQVLDFGSGFGITADALAAENQVTAVEPLVEMTRMTEKNNPFRQIIGDVTALNAFPNECFDLIVCHNVLEYVGEREEILKAFSRLLRKGGVLSVIRHNHPGRIMQKVVFENALDEAKALLEGGSMEVRNFGSVYYYEPQQLEAWGSGLSIQRTLGIRIFWALQAYDESKKEAAWQDRIFEIEKMVCDQHPYKDIAFFQHILLQKN